MSATSGLRGSIALATASAMLASVLVGCAASAARSADPMAVRVAVERRTLTESVVTRGVVGYRRLATARARATGIVTRRSVAPDQVVEAGVELFRVDGRPVVAIGGAFPFWRDLTMGVEPGADVQQLETMLAQAGYKTGKVDRRFTSATHSALQAWQRAHRLPADGVLRVGDTIVARWPARVGRVDIAVGDDITAGQDAFELTTADPIITVPVTPLDRARLETGMVVRVGTGAGSRVGRIVAIADLPELDESGAETYTAAIELDDPGGERPFVVGTFVRVEVVVRQAVDAISVPLAAIVLDGDGRESVRVIDDDGSVGFQAVSIGIFEGAYAEVLDGLRGTEIVILGTQG